VSSLDLKEVLRNRFVLGERGKKKEKIGGKRGRYFRFKKRKPGQRKLGLTGKDLLKLGERNGKTKLSKQRSAQG